MKTACSTSAWHPCKDWQETRTGKPIRRIRKMFKVKFTVSLLLLSLSLWLSATAVAQGTAFTYQGKLTDSGTLANGNYDFQFKLFDALAAGSQLGTTQTATNITVTNG